jgi:hypothetical protein
MTYFDAIASGRFKRVEEQWAFYPWGESIGYLVPARENYWTIHAWAAQIVKVWVLLTGVVWVLVGPASIPLVAVPLFARYRRRLRQVVKGLPRTAVRLTRAESYRIRGEAHSWRTLWLAVAASVVATSVAFAAAVMRPELRIVGVIMGLWFTAVLPGLCFMIRCKWRGDARTRSIGATEPLSR